MIYVCIYKRNIKCINKYTYTYEGLYYLGVYIYVRAFRHIKLSQYYRDNRSIVMPGCKYIYMTKHEELGLQIGITRAATSTGYTND